MKEPSLHACSSAMVVNNVYQEQLLICPKKANIFLDLECLALTTKKGDLVLVCFSPQYSPSRISLYLFSLPKNQNRIATFFSHLATVFAT